MGAIKVRKQATPQEQIDKGVLDKKAIIKIIVELAHRISQGTMPAGLTKAQIRDWIRDNI